MSEKVITHTDLCIATAKRFISRIALYEYKSFIYNEQPDVLVYGEDNTALFEIKMSLSDFNADKYKDCRIKYRAPHWINHYFMPEKDGYSKKKLVKLEKGDVEINYIEREHLGNYRYFVCPAGIIPVEKVPEGWGLYYYKNGKFYKKKKSGYFRSNLKKENALIVHALRGYASGNVKGIMVNTYKYKENMRWFNA